MLERALLWGLIAFAIVAAISAIPLDMMFDRTFCALRGEAVCLLDQER